MRSGLAMAWIGWAAVMGAGADSPAEKAKAWAREMIPQTQLHGRVVCLAEEMTQRHGADLPTKHEHVYGLKTSAGEYYTLLRTKYSEAIFQDAAVREKELVLRGRVFPDSRIFEVMNIHSIRDGVECDLYYFCDICVIQTVAPGICECCQGPTVLMEKPLK